MCNHPCRLINLRPEFQALYTIINNNLFEAYNALDTFIVANLQNRMIDERKTICIQQNSAIQSQGKPVMYSDSFFNELEKSKVHTEDLDQKVKDKLQIVAQMNMNEYPRLINMCKEYSLLRIKNIEKNN